MIEYFTLCYIASIGLLAIISTLTLLGSLRHMDYDHQQKMAELAYRNQVKIIMQHRLDDMLMGLDLCEENEKKQQFQAEFINHIQDCALCCVNPCECFTGFPLLLSIKASA